MGPVQTLRYGDGLEQYVELTWPKGTGVHGCVVLLHGGFWRARYDLDLMRPLARAVADAGLAAANVEYRRVGGRRGGFPGTLADVAAAVDRIAGVPDLDTDRLVLAGHSAGGQLALWAASREDSAVPIARVAALAAVCDMSKAEIAREVLGGSPDQVAERYDAVDPIRGVPLPMPVLLVHGAEDQTVPVERSREYAAAARAAGGDVELVEPPDTDHRAFVDPRSEGWRTAAEWILREWTSAASPSTPSARSST